MAGPVHFFSAHSGRIESLQEFKSLRSLKIPHFFLSGAQSQGDTHADHDKALDGYIPPRLEALLPSSLETLHLLWCQDDIEALDLNLVEVITSGRLSRLRRIRMNREEPLTQYLGPLGWIASSVKRGVLLCKGLNR